MQIIGNKVYSNESNKLVKNTIVYAQANAEDETELVLYHDEACTKPVRPNELEALFLEGLIVSQYVEDLEGNAYVNPTMFSYAPDGSAACVSVYTNTTLTVYYAIPEVAE